MLCPLRKCQGRRGCLCPSKPPPFIYSKTTDKKPTVQELIPIIPAEFIRQPPLYIGETAPAPNPVTRVRSSPKKNKPPSTVPKPAPVKAITAKLPQSEPKFDLSGERGGDEEEQNKEDAKSKKISEVVVDDIRNGKVQINFNHYKKEFDLVNGSITAEAIDDIYALTFAFPKCKIHLSTYSPTSFAFEDLGLSSAPLEEENPPGTFQKLKKTTVYWVHVEEDKDELENYLQRQDTREKEFAAKRKTADDRGSMGINTTHSSRAESCSCIEGNPCMDRYGCKNWENRYEIAKKNGWKGF